METIKAQILEYTLPCLLSFTGYALRLNYFLLLAEQGTKNIFATKHWLLWIFVGMPTIQTSYIFIQGFFAGLLFHFLFTSDSVTVQLTQVLHMCFRIINKLSLMDHR